MKTNTAELARREARVAETWAAWRDAVEALEDFRRYGEPREVAKRKPMPPPLPRLTDAKPVHQDVKPRSGPAMRRRRKRSQPIDLPASWPKDGTPCARIRCDNNLTYPRDYKNYCSEACYQNWLKAWAPAATTS